MWRWLSSACGAVRPFVLVSGGVAAGLVAVAVALTSGGGSPTPGVANIWTDPNGGTCVDNTTPVAYNDATACSPNQANQTCEASDTVRMKGGTYAAIEFTGTNGRTSSCTMLVEDGETATITGYIQFNSDVDYLTVRGEGWRGQNPDQGQLIINPPIQAGATGVGMSSGTNNDCVDGAIIDLHGVSPTGPGGGEAFGFYSPGNTQSNCLLNSKIFNFAGKGVYADHNGQPVTDFLVQGNYIGDMVRASTGAHMEGLYFNGVLRPKIYRNVFWNNRSTGALNNTCSGDCLPIDVVGGTSLPRDVEVIGNLFGPVLNNDNEGVRGIVFDGCDQCNGTTKYSYNLTIRPMPNYNGISQNGGYQQQAVDEMIGNVGPLGNCIGPTTYSNNVSNDTSCGSGDVVVSDLMSNAAYWTGGLPEASINSRPSALNPAAGAGSLTTPPLPFDLIGCARSGTADAGPYKVGGC